MIETIERAIEFARLAYPDLGSVDFEIPKQGQDYFTLLGPTEVVRIPRWESRIELMPHEVKILQALEKTSIAQQVPQLLDFDESNNIMRISRLQGVSLSEELLMGLPLETRQSIGQKVGTLLADLHQQTTEEEPLRTDDQIQDIKRKLHRIAQYAPEEDIAVLKNIGHYLEHFNEGQNCSLVHGDLNLGNIMYDAETGAVGLIDFAYFAKTSRYLDLGNTLCYRHIDGYLEGVHEGYEQKSGIEIDQEKLYLQYLAHNILCGEEEYYPGYYPSVIEDDIVQSLEHF